MENSFTKSYNRILLVEAENDTNWNTILQLLFQIIRLHLLSTSESILNLRQYRNLFWIKVSYYLIFVFFFNQLCGASFVYLSKRKYFQITEEVLMCRRFHWKNYYLNLLTVSTDFIPLKLEVEICTKKLQMLFLFWRVW